MKVTLRSLGLQIIRPFKQWRGSEEPKIAVRKSRSIAAARASIHLVPVVACAIILGYNFRVVFVAYNSAYTALQYVAKLHEMLMQASIIAMVVGYIRHRLVGRTSLPFGALLAGNQVHNLSTLFSLEYWGAVTAPSLMRGQRAILFLLLLAAVLLAASVGPSSAILMQPRVIRPAVGSFDLYINETFYFPAQMNSGNPGFA
jgi:hypothetical protein